MSDTFAPPQSWAEVLTIYNTRAWVRPNQIDSYGEPPPNTGAGNSWVSLIGSDARSYLLTTVPQLHAILGNAVAVTKLDTSS